MTNCLSFLFQIFQRFIFVCFNTTASNEKFHQFGDRNKKDDSQNVDGIHGWLVGWNQKKKTFEFVNINNISLNS